MLCWFLLYSKVNQLYVYIHPLFFLFPSHLGHHRALSSVPCAIQQVLISYLFYTQYQQCIYVNPNLPIHPTSPFPIWYPYIYSLHWCLYLCFANKIIYTIFLGFPGGAKELACQCGSKDAGSIPGLGRSPGGGHGNPLQYSFLENPKDRGAWRATVHGVAKSRM